MKHFICKRCGAEKPLTQHFFRIEIRNKTGFSGSCIECERLIRYNREQKIKNSEKPKLDFLRCSKCSIEKPATEEYFHKHKRSLTGFKCACKECRKIETKKWNKSVSCKEIRKKRRKNDQIWRIKKNISSTIANSIRRNNGSKNCSCFQNLGYSVEELKAHLENQFEDWMTWDNWGQVSTTKRTWNIDHIYPQSKLPYDSVEHPNFIKCWELKNLRPLCSLKNIKKRDHILTGEEDDCYE